MIQARELKSFAENTALSLVLSRTDLSGEGLKGLLGAVCDASVTGIVAAIMHTIAVAGIDHVGLGSDFDGTITAPFDTAGLPMLTEALLKAGLSQEEIAKVLGGNVRRVLARNLPE